MHVGQTRTPAGSDRLVSAISIKLSIHVPERKLMISREALSAEKTFAPSTGQMSSLDEDTPPQERPATSSERVIRSPWVCSSQ